MSYVSCNNVGSTLSSTFNYAVTTGSNVPINPTPLVSGTTYTCLTWELSPTTGRNGVGTYIFGFTFDVKGDPTTEFSQVLVELYTNGGLFWDNEVLVGTTLPDENSHSFYMPFIYQHNLQTLNPVEIRLPATFAGTAPTITSRYTTIYKLT